MQAKYLGREIEVVRLTNNLVGLHIDGVPSICRTSITQCLLDAHKIIEADASPETKRALAMEAAALRGQSID